MYNGIGLTTARGSGTSGYVQKNLSTINKSKQKHEYRTEEDIKRMEAALNRPPNQEILDHQRKRQIELRCLEEREHLENQGYVDVYHVLTPCRSLVIWVLILMYHLCLIHQQI